MAITYLCDGCNAPIVEPIKVGHVIRRDYCAECAETANGLQTEIDRIHSQLSASWHSRVEKARAAVKKKLRVLPDVP
jgi:hypothetical protein